MNVLLIRTWETNIGNAIIEKGAKTIIESAFPSANVTETSVYPNYISSRIDNIKNNSESTLMNEIKNTVSDYGISYKVISLVYDALINNKRELNESVPRWVQRWEDGNEGLSNIIKYMNIDLAVIPGCVLGSGLAIMKPTLIELQHRDIPVIILGAGGGSYNPGVVKYVEEIFELIKPTGIITRDQTAFNRYSNYVETAYSGIDCGLFINDWYEPPESNRQYISIVFDKISEPSIDTDLQIIRANHAPYRNPGIGYSNRFAAIDRHNYYEPVKKEFFESENAVISDNIRDYLFIYANTELTISDRIHACIPTLVYGNEAEFHFDTPRAKLFENLENRKIIENSEVGSRIEVCTDHLLDEKALQIKEFKKMAKKSMANT